MKKWGLIQQLSQAKLKEMRWTQFNVLHINLSSRLITIQFSSLWTNQRSSGRPTMGWYIKKEKSTGKKHFKWRNDIEKWCKLVFAFSANKEFLNEKSCLYIWSTLILKMGFIVWKSNKWWTTLCIIYVWNFLRAQYDDFLTYY